MSIYLSELEKETIAAIDRAELDKSFLELGSTSNNQHSIPFEIILEMAVTVEAFLIPSAQYLMNAHWR